MDLLRHPPRSQAGITNDDRRVVDEVVDNSYGERREDLARDGRPDVTVGSGDRFVPPARVHLSVRPLQQSLDRGAGIGNEAELTRCSPSDFGAVDVDLHDSLVGSRESPFEGAELAGYQSIIEGDSVTR